MALITEILCRIYGVCLELISFFYPLSFLGCYIIYLLTTLLIITSETFNTVSMGLSSNKLLLPMMDSKVFLSPKSTNPVYPRYPSE